jgi:hypothetical protein
MYAMVCIRFDIAHAMGVVSQFMVNLRQPHLIALIWIFHYLKSIMDFSLCFRKNFKDLIMGKVHYDEVVNHSQGRAYFQRNVS